MITTRLGVSTLAISALFAGVVAGTLVRADTTSPPGAPILLAKGMSFEIYIRIQPGMSEAEVLARAGPPDAQSSRMQGDRRAVDEIKTFTYLPTQADPYTTVITLKNGVVDSVSRNKY